MWVPNEHPVGLGKGRGKKAGRVSKTKRINTMFDAVSQKNKTGFQRKECLPLPERR